NDGGLFEETQVEGEVQLMEWRNQGHWAVVGFDVAVRLQENYTALQGTNVNQIGWEQFQLLVAVSGMLSSRLCTLREDNPGSGAYWMTDWDVSRDKRGGNDQRRLRRLNVERALAHGSV
ncbi:5492_t:CDS:2, partial [Acaulospora colombiana]